jgi:hypothetical protein
MGRRPDNETDRENWIQRLRALRREQKRHHRYITVGRRSSGVMREKTSSLPSKASAVIINMVRDCGHSPLAAAIVSSIRGEGSGRWSCGSRRQINCGHSRVVGVITAGAPSTAPGLISLKHLTGYKSFMCELLTASGHQSRRGLVVNYQIDRSIKVGLRAVVVLVRSQRCRSRSRSKSWV